MPRNPDQPVVRDLFVERDSGCVLLEVSSVGRGSRVYRLSLVEARYFACCLQTVAAEIELEEERRARMREREDDAA